jgi:hypothetical protein
MGVSYTDASPGVHACSPSGLPVVLRLSWWATPGRKYAASVFADFELGDVVVTRATFRLRIRRLGQLR